MSKFAVIIPGAGQGERFGDSQNKIFAKLDGRPLFIRTLEHFVNRDDVCQTILVLSGRDLETVKSKYGPNVAFMGVKVVEGGPTRCESVASGLKALADEAEYVAVHDAVRPCTTESMIDDVFAEAVKSGAAILACPIHGTLKRVSEGGTIDETVPRAQLYEAQTPQVFKRDVILEAYAKVPDGDDVEITDDAQMVELSGHPVSVVTSDPSNLKITSKADITMGNAVLKARPTRQVKKGRLGAFEEAQW